MKNTIEKKVQDPLYAHQTDLSSIGFILPNRGERLPVFANRSILRIDTPAFAKSGLPHLLLLCHRYIVP